MKLKSLLIASACIMLTGCISLINNITVNSDGSGSVQYKLYITGLDMTNKTQVQYAKEQLSQEIDDAVYYVADVTRDEVVVEEDTVARYIEGDFSDIKDLNGENFTYIFTAGSLTIESSAAEEKPDYPDGATEEEKREIDRQYEANRERFRKLFENQYFTLSVTAPAQIKNASGNAEISGTTATWTMPMSDIYLANKKFVITW